jgi:integrase
MATMFTQQQIRGLKAKATDRRQEFRDLGGDNLYVVVQPRSGETSFVIRPTIEGKQRRITLGVFPSLSLADARDRTREFKSNLRKGQPLRLEGIVQADTKAESITVAEAWDLYWQHEGSGRKSANEKERIFNKDVAPFIGSKLLSQVSRQELNALISSKFTVAKTASNRLHSLLGRFFKWCFTHGQALTRLEKNPMESVAKMHSERDSARRRHLDKDELVWWFEALPTLGESQPIHELLMRTLCRFSDILHLTWSEVVERENGDLVLQIADTKNAQAHVAYLHPSAAKLLPKRPTDAKPTDRVFTITTRSSKHIERLRKQIKKLAEDAGREVPHWQPHDYRRTGTTALAQMTDANDNPLVQTHILKRLLGHKEQDVIRHYNVYAYYKEKKTAIRLWNDYLDNNILQFA